MEKAGCRVDREAALEVRGDPCPYVSRGGLKLRAALEHWPDFPVEGRRFLDAGASTGGFTDCLLQRGAAAVWAVDVGRGQLHQRLRDDPRVVSRERSHIRDLQPDDAPFPLEAVTADLSFISLRAAFPHLARLAPGAPALLLVKPQFEAGPGGVGRGGVVRDPDTREQAIQAVVEYGVALGGRFLGRFPCPLKGPKGNQEEWTRWILPPA